MHFFAEELKGRMSSWANHCKRNIQHKICPDSLMMNKNKKGLLILQQYLASESLLLASKTSTNHQLQQANGGNEQIMIVQSQTSNDSSKQIFTLSENHSLSETKIVSVDTCEPVAHPELRPELIHITKTGGTTLEIVGAIHNFTWGACHWLNRVGMFDLIYLYSFYILSHVSSLSKQTRWALV